ncbi:MAG TPA: class I SAM-dependent methyltransferase [Solirubrobacteraceae bacterium]|nr:class I SAM-dependent methyltransferase [Solirubrobacteraceae bacterium]
MSAPARAERDGALPDPFAAAGARPPGRPRILSYVGRWGRARRWLGQDAMRVLDVGCAFGFGSAAIVARGPAERTVVGVERDPELLARAGRQFPWLAMIDGDAGELPVADGCADAVLLLDVIEHMAEPRQAIAEAHRVLRSGGTIIVSVPHRGPTRVLDAVNVYSRLRRRRPEWPELEGVVGTDEGEHRHFSLRELTALLEPQFTVERVARTGLGLQELVTLSILALRVPLKAPRAARVIMPLHLIAYIVDDLMPTGAFAYHLAVRARRNELEHPSAEGASARNGAGGPGTRGPIERNQP